jgi:hypothetical protein
MSGELGARDAFSSPATMKLASTGSTAPVIVIDTDILSSGRASTLHSQARRTRADTGRRTAAAMSRRRRTTFAAMVVASSCAGKTANRYARAVRGGL